MYCLTGSWHHTKDHDLHKMCVSAVPCTFSLEAFVVSCKGESPAQDATSNPTTNTICVSTYSPAPEVSFSLQSSCKVRAAGAPQVWREKQENSFKMKVWTKEGFEASNVLVVGSLHDNTVSGFQRETEQRLTAGKGVTLNPAAPSRKHPMVCSRKGIQQLHSKSWFMFWLICDFV